MKILVTVVLVAAIADALGENVSPGLALDEELKGIRRNILQIARQMITDSTAREERIRAEGDSGLKLVRNSQVGTRPYYSQTYTRRSFAAIHDHANNIRTVGMGEVIAVINGVQFRTRHNDYRLRKPSMTSKNYHETQHIDFPEVPPSVRNKGTAAEQIKEMREYFRAFSAQNETHRPYKDYFKPVVCYMEGAWTKSETNISEPFFSDRHFIEARTWYELLQKIRMMAYTGSKNNNENYAYLPTQIMYITDDGEPVFAQWNYRILCHPLTIEVPLNAFQVVDDLTSRMTMKNTLAEHLKTRAARFVIRPNDRHGRENLAYKHGLLDKIMEEVPGKDNYLADLEDDSMGMGVYDVEKNKKKNVGYYHRNFRVLQNGAMGTNFIFRGFNDQNMFMAATTQEEVAPMVIDVCKRRGRRRECQKFSMRCSWAIPLEIIYLTPLYNWNPLDIPYRGDAKSDSAKAVTADQRNGGDTDERAFNGTHSRLFYMTPVELFSSGEKNKDSADTTRGSVAVLDENGVKHRTTASGTRIILPSIGDVGPVRTRYPIAPVHDEGDNTRKELEVLKDILMNLKKYKYLLNNFGLDEKSNENEENILTIKTGMSKANTKVKSHDHIVELTKSEVDDLRVQHKSIVKETQQANSHTHRLQITAIRDGKFRIIACDDKKHDKGGRVCWDHHPRIMVVTED